MAQEIGKRLEEENRVRIKGEDGVLVEIRLPSKAETKEMARKSADKASDILRAVADRLDEQND